jgi:hypothetical protein
LKRKTWSASNWRPGCRLTKCTACLECSSVALGILADRPSTLF